MGPPVGALEAERGLACAAAAIWVAGHQLVALSLRFGRPLWAVAPGYSDSVSEAFRLRFVLPEMDSYRRLAAPAKFSGLMVALPLQAV